MRLTYTDEKGVELGTLASFELDLAFGSDENDFDLVLPPGAALERKALVYVAGTEWGGIVRGRRDSTMTGRRVCAMTGRTWHGMLAEAFLPPDEGAQTMSVAGEANTVLRRLVGRLGLSDVFDVADEESGIVVSCSFGAYEEAYAGIRRMLSSVGAKLAIMKSTDAKPVLSAVLRGEYVDDRSSSSLRFELHDDTPCNHLVCLGEDGDGARIVVHRYADKAGEVSGAQTQFGADERTRLLEVSSSEYEELVSEGTARLLELQNASGIELALSEGKSFDIGDVVGINDDETGVLVTAEVEKVIVNIANGRAAVTNEIGDVRRKGIR